jgi:DNA-binding NtrC family response regulator
MAFFEPDEWAFTEEALGLLTANPFRPNWGELAEGQNLLGQLLRNAPEAPSYRPGADLWGPQSIYSEELHQRFTKLGESVRQRLESGRTASGEELGRYELLALYCLYCRYGEEMDRFIGHAVRGHDKRFGEGHPPQEEERQCVMKAMWESFEREYETWFHFKNLRPKYEKKHVFACFFLFRRAIYHIFFNIVGTSKPIAELRSAVWESIITHDLLGWMQGLHRRMKDFPTLITGPSGTGKERVAEAIGRSLYIPFDSKKEDFEVDFLKAFNPVNLSALPPLLIEAELFGHVEGSFAGAVCDRVGRLEKEACPEHGAVFLDEIGELSAEIQVKLLRVLQTRRFQRVGENEDREFLGKVIAATNRDLTTEMRAGHFREDFYYRLCADQITTPSLQEQLADRPEDLPLMVWFVCRPVVGEDKAEELAQEVVCWIEKELPGYTWPGNFRELEQCVRSYTLRKKYRPIQPRAEGRPPPGNGDPVAGACATLADAVLHKRTTYKEIRRQLVTLVREGTLTAQEAAKLLGIDYRTLQSYMKARGRHRRVARERE